jgi:hypothetical protein
MASEKEKPQRHIKAKIIISVLVSFVLICGDYFFQNNKYPWLDDLMTFSLIEYFTGANAKLPFDEDSIFCVNVAHDKALTTYTSSDRLIRGNDEITDRDSLLKFLRIAAKARSKYIFMDIRFSKQHQTSTDSALFASILSIPNIVVSTHSEGDDYELADKALKPKTALADYGVTLTTGFSRYEFLQDGGASVALRMYRDIDHGDITRWHGLFFDTPSNQICLNAPFIPFPETINRYKDENTVRYPYLGSQLFSYYTEDELIEMMQGKYILIGDFDEDLHETYVGDVPGPMLSFISYKFLKDGKHLVSIPLFLLMLFIYSTICTCILCDFRFKVYSIFMDRLYKGIDRIRLSGISYFLLFLLETIRLILALIGWSGVIFSITFFSYVLFDVAILSVLPTIAIAIISYINSPLFF